MKMLDEEKPIQAGLSFVLICISLFFICIELWTNRHSPSELHWDAFTKIAVGIGTAGLALAPFDFTNVWKAIQEFRNKGQAAG